MPEEVSPVPCLRKLHSAVKHKHILSLGPWTQKDTLLPVPIASSSPKEDPSIMENKENLAFGTQEIKDGPAVPRLRVPVSSSAQSKPKQAASINAVHPQSSTAGRLHESEELKRGLEACPGSPLPPYYHQDSRFLPGCPSSESTLVPGVVTRTVREKASRTPQGLGKWQAEGTCEDEALQQVGLCLFLGRFEQLQGVTRLALLQALLESIKAAAGATVGEHVDHDDDPDLRRALEESLQEVASPAGEMYEKQAKSPSQAWQPSVRVVDEELEALLANRAGQKQPSLPCARFSVLHSFRPPEVPPRFCKTIGLSDG